MKTTLRLFAVYFSLFFFGVVSVKGQHQPNIKITFVNYTNGYPLVLDSGFTNCWKENFTVQVFKYYISNIGLQTTDQQIHREPNSYHLVDERDSNSKSWSFYLPAAKYDSLFFLIGVDSLKNVSGAQTAALDPLNGMFWTWNSGYIMFKMEGSSPQSSVINNKMEYHIGGFSGVNSTLKKTRLALSETAISVSDKSLTEIIVRFDIDKIWQAATPIKITDTPVCTTPGTLAAGIAANYSHAFDIIKIVQQ